MNTFVYFLKPVGKKGPIKIGCSFRPVSRLTAMMSWSPYKLEIVAQIEGDFVLERKIHNCFADSHSHGEWFKASARLLRAIEHLQQGVPVEQAIDLTSNFGSIRKVGIKPKRTPERRLYISYGARLRCAFRSGLWMPADVSEIMTRWFSADHSHLPSSAELARLEEVLREPSKHAVTYEQRFGRSEVLLPHWKRNAA